jgi:predicted RNase H-like nuclease
MAVLGVDACPSGWCGILLDAASAPRACWGPTITDLMTAAGPVELVGIDIPIGLPEDGVRECDTAARALVGPRRSSVFIVPIRAAIMAESYEEANEIARSVTGRGISRQSYALGPKIGEVADFLETTDIPVHEIHPELSFATLAGAPMGSAKKTWSGAHERRMALESAGIVLEGDLGEAGRMAGFDDVLDAAAAAWTARRVLDGTALTLPSEPADGPAIWA